jgi:Ribonuclease G/E
LSGGRHVLLDVAPGETRALILSDGRPERLLVERVEDLADVHRLDARVRGRVRRIERGSGLAFIDLGVEPDGVMPASALEGLAEGAVVDVIVAAEPRAGKGPALRLLAASQGETGLLAPGPSLSRRLEEHAPGRRPQEGREARDRIDEAVDLALGGRAKIPGGGVLSVEPTRALVAVDVDWSDAPASDFRQGARRINLAALDVAARMVRLADLGGLVVIDLIGKGHDGDAVRNAAETAFAPDQPGVVFGPVTRFGTFELSIPWRKRPLREALCDPGGRRSALTVGLRLLREIEGAAAAEPGGRVVASAEPAAAEAARRHARLLEERIGPRFEILDDLALPRERTDLVVR